MEEKNNTIIEEEDGYDCMTAAEPVLAYTAQRLSATGIVYMDEGARKIDRIPMGAFRFLRECSI